jgi:hypothetical protein
MEFTDASAVDLLLFLKNSDPEVIHYIKDSEHFLNERLEMVKYIKNRMKQHVQFKCALAAKLEHHLYISACNIDEYNDKETLKKRIDDVVDKSRKKCLS